MMSAQRDWHRRALACSAIGGPQPLAWPLDGMRPFIPRAGYRD